MPKTLLVSGAQSVSTAGATEVSYLANANVSIVAVEANRQVPFPAGTLSKLYVYLGANSTSASSTVRTRKNGANGNLTVTIGAAATGVFEDTTNSDTVAAADLMNYQTVSGGTGTMTVRLITTIFDATTNTVGLTLQQFSTLTTASTTAFHSICGQGATNGTATESQVQYDIRKACTLKNLFVRVSANARTTTTTIRTRKNAANGAQSVSIGNGATGLFQDTTNSDTIAVGDDVNFSSTTGTGTQTLTYQSIGCWCETTTGDSPMTAACDTAGDAISANLTRYNMLAGEFTDTANEDDNEAKAYETFTMNNLTVRISTNTVTASTTVRTRKGGANGAQSATIGSSATGLFQDTTNSDTLATTDTINYQIVTGATGTSISVTFVGVNLNLAAGASFTRTASDTISISDVSVTRISSLARIPSTDSVTLGESSVRMLSASRVPSSDTTTIADASLTRSRGLPRVPSTDSSTVTDSSLVRMLSANRTPSSDVISIGETPARMLSALRLPSSDSITVVDSSLIQQKTLTRTGSDTTGVSDSSLTRLLSAIRVPALDTVTVTAGTSTRMLSATRVPSLDTVATTEQTIGGKVYGRIPSTDTVTIVDSAITRLLSAVRSPSDTTPVNENLIRILSAFRVTSSDTTTVADVSVLRIRSLTRTGSDNTAVVDSSLTRLLQASRSPSQDTVLVSDSSLVRLLSALRLVSAETITVNENITATQSQSIVRTASDNTAVTDGTLSRFLSATRVPSLDIVTVTDSSLVRRLQLVRVVGPDTIATSESISRALTTAGVFSRTASDTVAIAEASLIRLLSSIRTASDTSPISENLVRSATRIRAPATDSRTIADVSVTRVRSLTRLPTQDTMNIVEASLIRLLSLARNLSDTTVITEVQNAITHSKALVDTVNVTEPLLQRIVSASRNLSDIVNISEAVFYQTWHRFVFDTVVVGEQLFSIRQALSGSVTYATPDEVRPLLGNLGSQRTDDQINLAIDAAYDEINTKTNRIPPNDWKDTDHNFGIVKKLTRYIAAKEMAIGIKDFDTKPLEMEIEHLFNDLLTYDTTSDATQDIVGSSPDVTFALNEGGVIWSTRYRNLRKNAGDENSTTINPNT